MKVLLVNGSPHEKGCTFTALTEVAETLNAEGISTEFFWIGNKPLSGCIACKACIEKKKCVFNDSVNEFLDIAGNFDGFVFGTPVHFAAASGAITSFMLFSCNSLLDAEWPVEPWSTAVEQAATPHGTGSELPDGARDAGFPVAASDGYAQSRPY